VPVEALSLIFRAKFCAALNKDRLAQPPPLVSRKPTTHLTQKGIEIPNNPACARGFSQPRILSRLQDSRDKNP
jgi:hypothetical protein